MSKYIDADLLRKEIDHRIDILEDMSIKCAKNNDTEMHAYYHGKAISLQELLSFIGSFQQEQPSLPNDLDEAAMEIVIKMHPCLKDCTILGDRLTRGQLMALVKAGAEWQMKQMLKDGNVILAEEDFDAEKEKSMEWGYNLCKEQMLKEAVEGEIQMRYSGCLCAKTVRAINEDKFKLGDKVRLIVLKAEEE